MQIFIRNGATTSTMSVDPSSSVQSLKNTIENESFLTNFRLVNNGVELVDASASLSAAGLTEASTLTMLYSVVGGMRAKWRKKRMRRLQRKRRKMRQRAR